MEDVTSAFHESETVNQSVQNDDKLDSESSFKSVSDDTADIVQSSHNTDDSPDDTDIRGPTFLESPKETPAETDKSKDRFPSEIAFEKSSVQEEYLY